MPKTIPYEYVRNHYGVPAAPGMRVTMPGHRPTETGVVVRKKSYDHYVHVRFDGQKFDVPVHPMDLQYETSSTAAESRKCIDCGKELAEGEHTVCDKHLPF